MEKDSNLEKKISHTIFRASVVSLKSSRLQAYLNAFRRTLNRFLMFPRLALTESRESQLFLNSLIFSHVIGIILPDNQLHYMKP